MLPQAIGGEELQMVDYIKQFYRREPWFLVIDDLREISIVQQELPKLDSMIGLWSQIQQVTMDNCWMSSIYQMPLNGTTLYF